MHKERVTSGHQVAGHGFAHDAQTDKSQIHVFLQIRMGE
jgi:hypothetical protein